MPALPDTPGPPSCCCLYVPHRKAQHDPKNDVLILPCMCGLNGFLLLHVQCMAGSLLHVLFLLVGRPLTDCLAHVLVHSCICCCRCAGVFMTLAAVNVKPAVCKLIKGDKTAGVFKRAMTRMRADVEHMDMLAIVGAQ